MILFLKTQKEEKNIKLGGYGGEAALEGVGEEKAIYILNEYFKNKPLRKNDFVFETFVSL